MSFIDALGKPSSANAPAAVSRMNWRWASYVAARVRAMAVRTTARAPRTRARAVPRLFPLFRRERRSRSSLDVAEHYPFGDRVRLAAQHEAARDLVVVEREVLVHPDLAFDHLGAAGAADAGLARERQVRPR